MQRLGSSLCLLLVAAISAAASVTEEQLPSNPNAVPDDSVALSVAKPPLFSEYKIHTAQLATLLVILTV